MSAVDYLRTSFEGPEPDYVNGELVERSMPNLSHSLLQIRLADAFKSLEDRRKLFRSTEIRLRVSHAKFRVADFAAFSTEVHEQVPELPPYLVVEIVSPDDRYEDIMSKLADYEEAGVEFIFLADTPVRKLSRFRRGDLVGVAALELPAYGASIPLSAIFG